MPSLPAHARMRKMAKVETCPGRMKPNTGTVMGTAPLAPKYHRTWRSTTTLPPRPQTSTALFLLRFLCARASSDQGNPWYDTPACGRCTLLRRGVWHPSCRGTSGRGRGRHYCCHGIALQCPVQHLCGGGASVRGQLRHPSLEHGGTTPVRQVPAQPQAGELRVRGCYRCVRCGMGG